MLRYCLFIERLSVLVHFIKPFLAIKHKNMKNKYYFWAKKSFIFLKLRMNSNGCLTRSWGSDEKSLQTVLKSLNIEIIHSFQRFYQKLIFFWINHKILHIFVMLWENIWNKSKLCANESIFDSTLYTQRKIYELLNSSNRNSNFWQTI